MFRLVMVPFTLAALLGCTTMRPLDVSDPESVRVSLAPGNHVTVLTAQQQTYELQLTAVAGDAMSGVDANGATRKVPYADIVKIEVRRMSHWKTNGLLIGTSVVSVLFIALVLCC